MVLTAGVLAPQSAHAQRVARAASISPFRWPWPAVSTGDRSAAPSAGAALCCAFAHRRAEFRFSEPGFEPAATSLAGRCSTCR